jgi:hypothetical protein
MSNQRKIEKEIIAKMKTIDNKEMQQCPISSGLPVYYEFIMDDNMEKGITHFTCEFQCENIIENDNTPSRPLLRRNKNVFNNVRSSEINRRNDMISFLKGLSKKE